MDAIGQSHETRPFLVSRNQQNRKIEKSKNRKIGRWASHGKHFIGVIFGTFSCSDQEKKSSSADAFVSLFFFFFFLTQSQTQNDKTFSLQSISFLFFT